MGVAFACSAGDGRSVEVLFDDQTLVVTTAEIVNPTQRTIRLEVESASGTWERVGAGEGSFEVTPAPILVQGENGPELDDASGIRCEME